jgi:hypothetical protein
MAVLAFGAVGCGSNDVWVYWDNTGQDRMVVTVDGQEGPTIAPGKFEVVKYPPGKRRFRVESGGLMLFEGPKELKPSDKWGVCRKYMFNPCGRNRYVTYTAKYGSTRFEGLLKAALRPDDREGALGAAYRELAQELKLLPADDWIDVGDVQYVLESPPDQVRTKYSTATRTVLMRVTRPDYALLESAQQKTSPSEQDLEALAEAVERVLDAAP